jgi:hypothetical protein
MIAGYYSRILLETMPRLRKAGLPAHHWTSQG